MAFSKFKLDGRVALITGASGLLGQEHASALLESGAKVVLTDISKKNLEIAKTKLSKLFHTEMIYTKIMDVTSKDAIIKVFQELINYGLRIDVLINNAAIDPKVDQENGLKEISRLENFDLDQWNLELNVGLTGAFLCSQVFGSKRMCSVALHPWTRMQLLDRTRRSELRMPCA